MVEHNRKHAIHLKYVWAGEGKMICQAYSCKVACHVHTFTLLVEDI